MTWAAVALADKADTVVGLFGAGEKPTGSRDPLGIRRQAQGMLRILVDLPELTGLDVRVSVRKILAPARKMHTKDPWSRVYWALTRIGTKGFQVHRGHQRGNRAGSGARGALERSIIRSTQGHGDGGCTRYDSSR